MEMHGNMKCGYQGKHDSMRAQAEKLLNHSEGAKRESKTKNFKKGGVVSILIKNEKIRKPCKKIK